MAGDVESKVITRYIADTSQERAAIDALIRKVSQLKDVESRAAGSRENHFDQLVLDLSRAARGTDEVAVSWEGWNRKADGLASTLTSALGKTASGLNKVANAMSPWNQALELGNRLVGFASESMDQYAKTNAQAAKDVAKVKQEFAEYRDAVMAGAGRMAVELLKPAVSFQEQSKALLKIGNSPAFKILYGDGGKGGALNGARFADQLSDEFKATAARFGILIGKSGPIESLTNAYDNLRKSFGQMVKESSDHWSTDGQAFVNSLKDGLEGVGKTATRTAVDVQRSVRSMVRVSGGGGNVGSFASAGSLGIASSINAGGFATDEQRLLEQVSQEHLGNFQEMTSRESRFASSQSRRTDSFLAQHLGEIEEFDHYKAAFEGLSSAIGGTYEAIVTGAEPAGQAFKRLIADSLLALGKQSAVEAIKEFAYAAGSAAFGNFAGAALHLKAAALHGAVAVAAGATASSLGAGGGGQQASGGTSAGGGGGASGGGGSGSGRGETVTNYIIVGSDHAENSPRMMQRKAKRIVNLADEKTSSGGAF